MHDSRKQVVAFLLREVAQRQRQFALVRLVAAGRAAQGLHGSSGDVDGLHDELARRHGDELDPVLVGEGLQPCALEEVGRRLGHLGGLGEHILAEGGHLLHRGSQSQLAVPQHPGVGVGNVLLGQVGVTGDVHGDVGKRRRQLA